MQFLGSTTNQICLFGSDLADSIGHGWKAADHSVAGYPLALWQVLIKVAGRLALSYPFPPLREDLDSQ